MQHSAHLLKELGTEVVVSPSNEIAPDDADRRDVRRQVGQAKALLA